MTTVSSGLLGDGKGSEPGRAMLIPAVLFALLAASDPLERWLGSLATAKTGVAHDAVETKLLVRLRRGWCVCAPDRSLRSFSPSFRPAAPSRPPTRTLLILAVGPERPPACPEELRSCDRRRAARARAILVRLGRSARAMGTVRRLHAVGVLRIGPHARASARRRAPRGRSDLVSPGALDLVRRIAQAARASLATPSAQMTRCSIDAYRAALLVSTRAFSFPRRPYVMVPFADNLNHPRRRRSPRQGPAGRRWTAGLRGRLHQPLDR